MGKDGRFDVAVTFDERRGYVGTHPELRAPVTALSLGGLRRKVEAAMLPEEVNGVYGAPAHRCGQSIALGPTDTGRCVMALRSSSVMLASLLLSTLIAAPAAAVCKSPKNICKHIDECLQRSSEPNNKAAGQIREGVKTRNGNIVWAGAEACARDLGRKKQWDDWTRQCSAVEYVSIAKLEMELGKAYCDRYSQ